MRNFQLMVAEQIRDDLFGGSLSFIILGRE